MPRVRDKLCLQCREVKPVTAFYKNAGWESQLCVDTICRDCAKKNVYDKDTVRKYFWEQNRVWSEEIWTAARKKAMYVLSTNKEYIKKNTSAKRREELENVTTAMAVFSIMNLDTYYRFVDNEDTPYNPESTAGTTQETSMTRNDEEMLWSEEWGGMFSRRELRYLDNYMERLQEEFVLDNINREDYARRVALASLDANNKYQKMRQGTGTAKEWQEAQAAFDAMSKSGSFAESQRKEITNTKMSALGLIIMDIELNHHNEMPQVTFPKDDVDKILRDFGFTGEAIS